MQKRVKLITEVLLGFDEGPGIDGYLDLIGDTGVSNGPCVRTAVRKGRKSLDENVLKYSKSVRT